MPRYELTEGKSNKFWEISLEGSSFTTRYGRIGSDGKSTRKAYDDPAKAKKEYEKLIASKVKKGYRLVEQAGGAAPAAPARVAVNPELERAIVADPAGDEAYLVYADWLQTQGDPRGELITIQQRLAQQPGDKALRQAEQQLLQTHGVHFLPPKFAEMLTRERGRYNSDADRCSARWHNGFLAAVVLARDNEDDDPYPLEELVEEVFAHPSARFVREVKLGALGVYDEYDYGPLVASLAKAMPATVRSVYIADFHSEQTELSWSYLGDLSPLLRAFPRLERATFRGGSMTLGALDLPRMKSFRVETGGLSRECIQSICEASWPQLESLHLFFGDENYGAEGSLADIGPILAADGLPRLKHLGLMNCEFTDAICAALPASKVLPQLETLDLSLGTMSDDGARALAATPAAFKALAALNVEDNYISDEGLKLLEGLCPTVKTKGQDEPDEWDGELHRYVTVGE